MKHILRVAAIFVWIFLLPTLAACDVATITPDVNGGNVILATPQLITESCEACDQATMAAALTQAKGNADFQAAATAEILRVNAQATLNSANATLNAAQTQQQNNTDMIAAQIAATAEIIRANAQATLNSAGSTQVAAMTQAQYNLQVTESVRTQSAIAMQTQQNKDDLAASTQTAIANNIATQTQSAVATSQWYADQERQRDEERQGPIAFLWTWCPPIFIVLLAGLVLWGFKHWLAIQQSNQRILENSVAKLPEPVAETRHHRHDDPVAYIEGEALDGGYQVTTPDDEVGQWLDEVKDELSRSDEKEKDDDPGK